MHEQNKRGRSDGGFSLLELMVSLAVFLVVAGAVMSALISGQKNYRNSEMRTALEQKMRSVMELLAQEVGQAGLQPAGVDSAGLGAPLTTVDSSACSESQTRCIQAGTGASGSPIPVSSTAGLHVGEIVWVDVGPGLNCYPTNGCEQNTIDKIEPGAPAKITFHVPFTSDHTLKVLTDSKGNKKVYRTPFYAMGAYPQGIVPPSAGLGTGSTSSQLVIFGDLDGAGKSLVAAIYACPGSYPGDFTRTKYDVQTAARIETAVLLKNVTECRFQYPETQTVLSNPVVPGVGLTLTVQSETKDIQTGQNITLTKTMPMMQPRNVVSGLHLVSSCSTDPSNTDPCKYANELQQAPSSLAGIQ